MVKKVASVHNLYEKQIFLLSTHEVREYDSIHIIQLKFVISEINIWFNVRLVHIRCTAFQFIYLTMGRYILHYYQI